MSQKGTLPSPLDTVGEDLVFLGCPYATFVRCSSRQILTPQYLMNGLSNLDETYMEYSLAPSDDWLDFGGRRSRSQQSAGHQGGKGIHINTSRSPYFSYICCSYVKFWWINYPAWGRGTPFLPLLLVHSLHLLLFISFSLFLFFIHFTYFLLCPSDPFLPESSHSCFQAWGHRWTWA